MTDNSDTHVSTACARHYWRPGLSAREPPMIDGRIENLEAG